jgi:hypothetical protein
MALIAVLSSDGSAQAPPSPGDRIRIRQVDGTVFTGTLDLWSTESVQLSGESVGRRWEVPVSAIETLEMSLGRQRSFGKYYGLTLAASTIVGGIIGLTKSSSSDPYYRGRSAAGGAFVGYLVGIPLGAFLGSRVTKERWSPVATQGFAPSGPTIRPVTDGDVGLAAGQRVRVRAADALSVEGTFVGFEGQNMLLNTTQAGQDQRIPTDRVQALWVRERNTRKGATIGAITGGVFFAGVILYGKEYVLDEYAEIGFGDVLAGGAIGAGLGAALGALIGYLVPGWSPVWP